jgi:hypothetical protein
MKLTEYIPIQHDDDYWVHDIPLCTAQFSYYRNEPRMVQGKIHVSQEHLYTGIVSEIVPLRSKKGGKEVCQSPPLCS